MKYFFYSLLLSYILILSGCSDGAIVRVFDKDVEEKRLPCLRLVLFPPDKTLESALHKLYKFTPDCEYRLEISQKGGIVCNSNQNAVQKTLTTFPSTYLRMDISEASKPLYSYYIDLVENVTSDDVERGFMRIKEDILTD